MAWAASALFLLDESHLLYALACLAWVAIAWGCLGARRLGVARRALALLLALALPAQGFAAAAEDLRGPAHVHETARSADRHWHGNVEHHHHAAGASIIVDDGSRQQTALASAEEKRVASGAGDAITAAPPVVAPAQGAEVLLATGLARLVTHAADTPERPPRLLLAFLPSKRQPPDRGLRRADSATA
jgi:hypothetical protein